MFDVLLNAAKLALSEDGRKSVSNIIEIIKRSPEWQRDICVVKAKVEYTHQEHAALLAGLAAAKLQSLDFTGEGIEAFRTSYLEMTTNAFEHGCAKDQAIGITIEVSTEYVSATIENARGYDFDMPSMLQNKRRQIAANPRSRRGRGLVLVAELSDTLDKVAPRGLKAVFYRSRVEFEKLNFRDLIVVRLNDGMLNPSLSRRLFRLISHALVTSDVVLDLSEYASYAGTVLVTVLLELGELGQTAGHELVVIVARAVEQEVNFFKATDQTVVTSWTDALNALKKSFNQDELLAALKTRPRLVYQSGWHRSRNQLDSPLK